MPGEVCVLELVPKGGCFLGKERQRGVVEQFGSFVVASLTQEVLDGDDEAALGTRGDLRRDASRLHEQMLLRREQKLVTRERKLPRGQ